MPKLLEQLEDSLYLLALHIAEDPNQGLLHYASDLIGSLREAGTPEDFQAIEAFKRALRDYGIPLCATEIATIDSRCGE